MTDGSLIEECLRGLESGKESLNYWIIELLIRLTEFSPLVQLVEKIIKNIIGQKFFLSWNLLFNANSDTNFAE